RNWKPILRPSSAAETAWIPPATPWRSRGNPGSTNAEDSMKEASRSHLVLIPSYNPGERVYETVQAARRGWHPVWIVVDASTYGTAEGLRKRAEDDPGLRVIVQPRNSGKGAAVLRGIELA